MPRESCRNKQIKSPIAYSSSVRYGNAQPRFMRIRWTGIPRWIMELIYAVQQVGVGTFKQCHWREIALGFFVVWIIKPDLIWDTKQAPRMQKRAKQTLPLHSFELKKLAFGLHLWKLQQPRLGRDFRAWGCLKKSCGFSSCNELNAISTPRGESALNAHNYFI